MIGPEEAIDARGATVIVERISGNGDAVAGDGDQPGRTLVAVEIAYQPRHPAEHRRASEPRTQGRRERRDADIDRDMPIEDRRIDAEIDVVGNMVGGVIGDDQDSARRPAACNRRPGFRPVARHSAPVIRRSPCEIGLAAAAERLPAFLKIGRGERVVEALVDAETPGQRRLQRIEAVGRVARDAAR